LIELKQIWLLIKTGYTKKKYFGLKSKILFITKILFVLILFKIVSIILIGLLEGLVVFNMPENIDMLKINEFTLLKRILIIIILSPVLEELAFRIGLKFSKSNFIIMLMGMSFFISRSFFKWEWLNSIMLITLVGILLYVIIKEKSISKLTNFWLYNPKLIFYSLLISFSYMHLKNYNISYELLLFSPIILLPNILGGIIYSYVRLSLGTFLSILLHCLNNGIPLMLSNTLLE